MLGARSQPQGLLRVNRAHPLARGLAFAYVPGSLVNAVGSSPMAALSGTARRQNGSLILDGSSANGLTLGSGALLGGLQTSTVIAVAASTGANGRAIYCERAPGGNDIYKLEVAGALGAAQFTYRNDSGNLLQVTTGNANAADGVTRLYAIVKNGATHTVYCYPMGPSTTGSLGATGSFGGDSSFTNGGMVRSVGFDVADGNANLPGHVDLVAGWPRALTEPEILAVRANPWLLFEAPDEDDFMASMAAAPPGNTYTAPAAQGSYTLTGNVVGLRAGRRMAAGTGAYALTGNVAKLTVGRRMAAALGAYTLTGNPANLIRGTAPRALQVSGGGYVITGRAATLRVARYLRATPGGYALTGAATGAPILGAAPNIYLATIMSEPVLNLAAPLGPAAVNLIGKML